MDDDHDGIVFDPGQCEIDLAATRSAARDYFRTESLREFDGPVAATPVAHNDAIDSRISHRANRLGNESFLIECGDDRREGVHRGGWYHPRMRGYVLAGGESRRMGRTKRELMLGNSTFLDLVVSALAPLVSDVSIVVREPSAGLEYPTLLEPPHDRPAPIYGIACALRSAEGDDALIVAVDYPLITTAALSILLTSHRRGWLTVPSWDAIPQMVCAIYTPSLLPLLDQKIRSGELDLRSLLSEQNAAEVSEDHLRARLPGEPFRNVNTPEDYSEAERIYGSSHSH